MIKIDLVRRSDRNVWSNGQLSAELTIWMSKHSRVETMHFVIFCVFCNLLCRVELLYLINERVIRLSIRSRFAKG